MRMYRAIFRPELRGTHPADLARGTRRNMRSRCSARPAWIKTARSLEPQNLGAENTETDLRLGLSVSKAGNTGYWSASANDSARIFWGEAPRPDSKQLAWGPGGRGIIHLKTERRLGGLWDQSPSRSLLGFQLLPRLKAAHGCADARMPFPGCQDRSGSIICRSHHPGSRRLASANGQETGLHQHLNLGKPTADPGLRRRRPDPGSFVIGRTPAWRLKLRSNAGIEIHLHAADPAHSSCWTSFRSGIDRLKPFG
jgi:hypothetical protein